MIAEFGISGYDECLLAVDICSGLQRKGKLNRSTREKVQCKLTYGQV